MVEARLIPDRGYPLPAEDENSWLGWLALARVKGLGCTNFKKLAEHFDDPRQALCASHEALARVQGLDREALLGLTGFSEWEEARRELARVEAAGARIVPYGAREYPARLRTIADPPPLLYIKGEIRPGDSKAVAIVGSRSASSYGIRITQELSRGLASLGFTVISGMARGIDGAAHEAALEAGGRSMAVLGCGIDLVYPPEHDRLYRRICGAGAVLSELPMGTPPFSFNFPARNRLISGLSLGVVVVEATEKSGSLITAGLALDQGREVFAVPGEAGASRSRGTHRLIRQGAKLVECAEDILEEIAPQLMERAAAGREKAPLALPSDLGEEAKTIFGLIAERSLQIDEVIEASKLPAGKVSEILLDLEMRGLLKQLPGKKFTAER